MYVGTSGARNVDSKSKADSTQYELDPVFEKTHPNKINCEMIKYSFLILLRLNIYTYLYHTISSTVVVMKSSENTDRVPDDNDDREFFLPKISKN